MNSQALKKASSALVSVVIPCFNRARLIESALNSVKRQDYRPMEVVIVDDGSTDDSANVVEKWAKLNGEQEFSVILLRQNNQGANVARNRGIEHASGEFVAFLDSDDLWLPEKISKQMEVFGQKPEVGGVYCGLRQVDLETGEKSRYMPRRYCSGNILRSLLVQDVTEPTSCWMVRKACFENAGLFDVSLPARQDWDMWIRLSAHYSIGCVPEALVEMGNHAGERVRSDARREILAHQVIFAKYGVIRKQFPVWVSLAARSAMYRRRGRMYFHRRISVPKAIGMQLLAIAVWPFAFDSYAALGGIIIPRKVRRPVRLFWNRVFGKTPLAIKTH